MFINVSDKKEFLVWLVSNVSFSRREVVWILNYLINHEAILHNVHFVEYVDKTKRGLRVAATDVEEKPIALFLCGKEFIDTDQIFHEIRMNWKNALYIECLFVNSWQNSQYLSVLEDNPFARWNEQVSEDIKESVQLFFEQEERKANVDLLYAEIDAALENNDHNLFLQLSTELNNLYKQE